MRKRSLVLFVAVVVAVVPVYGFSGEPNYSTNGLNGGKDEVGIAAGVSHGNGQGAPGTTLQKPGNDHGTPGTNPQNPGNDHGGPGTDPQKPGNDHGGPGTDPQKPGNDQGSPGTNPQNPGNDQGSPGTDPQNPGNGEQRPPQEQEKADFVIKPSHSKSGMGERRSYGPVRDYMRKHPGKKVIIEFTPGKYYVRDTMFLFDGAHIRAHGAVIKAVSRGKPVFLNALFKDSGYNTKKKKRIGGYNRCKNITIDGGTYLTSGKPAAHAGRGKYGRHREGYSNFMFMHAQNINIRNCTIVNNYNGHFIEFAGVKNSRIENVTFKGKYRGDSTNEVIQLDTTMSPSVSPQGAPWDGTPCRNIEIIGCKINVPSMPVGIGTNYQCRKRSGGFLIEKNFIRVKRRAVAMVKVNGATVRNNEFHRGKLYKKLAKKVRTSGNKRYKK